MVVSMHVLADFVCFSRGLLEVKLRSSQNCNYESSWDSKRQAFAMKFRLITPSFSLLCFIIYLLIPFEFYCLSPFFFG